MKVDVYFLRSLLNTSSTVLSSSIDKAFTNWKYYENDHYTEKQLFKLRLREQPPETFNIVRSFSDLIVGYLSSMTRTFQVVPRFAEDTTKAILLDDILSSILRRNSFVSESLLMTLDGILTGIICSYSHVVDTGKYDSFGRSIYDISIERVPTTELFLDPSSVKQDYSDARYIHRVKNISFQALKELFPHKDLSKIKRCKGMTPFGVAVPSTSSTTAQSEFADEYTLIHTIIKEGKKVFSYYWLGEHIIDKREITDKLVQSPYRLHKTNQSNLNQYKGLFDDILATQDAINQSILKIQLYSNTTRFLVEDGAVPDKDAFSEALKTMSPAIKVTKIDKLRELNLQNDINNLYSLVTNARDRIQKTLGVNDAFLGMSNASDSGRKVQIEKGATVNSLYSLQTHLNAFFVNLGKDVLNLVKQYYTAEQALKLTDEKTGGKWIELNKPLKQYSGVKDSNGTPIMEYVYTYVEDPTTGQLAKNEFGTLVVAPVSTEDTDINFEVTDLVVYAVNYNNEEEKNQLMLETVLGGGVGMILREQSPKAFLQSVGYSVLGMKTRNSVDIADALFRASELAPDVGVQETSVGSNNPEMIANPKQSPELQIPGEGETYE